MNLPVQKSKIIILGLPFFANKLAMNLQLQYPENQYLALDTNKSYYDKLKYFFHAFTADTIYQIGGNTYMGGALKLAYRLRKRIIFHWVGTDALMALANKGTQKFNKNFMEYAEHLCEVDWIANEMKQVGIHPKQLQIACLEKMDPSFNSIPNEFSILTYMTPGREKFYGLEKIIELAKKFPQIPINIVGIKTYTNPLPANINLLGWVENISEVYLKTSVYLRLPEHDGLSVSVLEALSMYRHVGYSQKLSGTQFIDSSTSLENFINALYERHLKKNLLPNEEGIQFIKSQFHKKTVIQLLNNYLTQS